MTENNHDEFRKKKSTFRTIWLPPILGAIAMCLLFYAVYWHLKQKRDRKEERKKNINIEFPNK